MSLLHTQVTCPALFSEGWQPVPGWYQSLAPRWDGVMPPADGPGPGNQATPWHGLHPHPSRAGNGTGSPGWRPWLWSLGTLGGQEVRNAPDTEAFTDGGTVR